MLIVVLTLDWRFASAHITRNGRRRLRYSNLSGEGSILAARSVVAKDVPDYVVVASNPARVVRDLPRDRC